MQEGILLDDVKPELPEISIDTLKAFLDRGEQGFGDGRYNAAKFARNQFCCILSNFDETLCQGIVELLKCI